MQLGILGTDNGEFIICGIIGFAGVPSKKNDDILSMLLVFDSIRGIDSTGIAGINKDNVVHTAKAVGNPYELIGSRAYNKATEGITRAIIGHNRWATQGVVNKRNAHPFEFESIVGVHNGTLTNKWELYGSKDFIVDSENLYYHMEEKGLEHLMGVMKGAWSLVWWDKRAETLNFLRNKERPMFICWSDDFKNLYWASESWMLSVALSRNGVAHTEICATDEDKLYAFPIDKECVVYKPHEAMHPSRAKVFTTPVVQTVGNRVITLTDGTEKKKEATGTKTLGDGSPLYAGKKSVMLEVLSLSVDRYGAKYYTCLDWEMPLIALRMYYQDRDEDKYEEGDKLLADISFSSYSEPLTFKYSAANYYKVMKHTVVRCDYVDEAAEKEEEDTNSHNVYHLDPKGKKKLLKDWLDDHGTCAVCTGFVDPSNNFRFATDGSAICHECVNHPETANMISFAK